MIAKRQFLFRRVMKSAVLVALASFTHSVGAADVSVSQGILRIEGTSHPDSIDVRTDQSGTIFVNGFDVAHSAQISKIVIAVYAGDDRVTLAGVYIPATVYLGAGDDEIRGGESADTIFCGEGNDRANGNRGADIIYGQGGNDLLRGGKNRDSLYGGAGLDELHGDLAWDYLFGGEDVDLFYTAYEWVEDPELTDFIFDLTEEDIQVFAF